MLFLALNTSNDMPGREISILNLCLRHIVTSTSVLKADWDCVF